MKKNVSLKKIAPWEGVVVDRFFAPSSRYVKDNNQRCACCLLREETTQFLLVVVCGLLLFRHTKLMLMLNIAQVSIAPPIKRVEFRNSKLSPILSRA